MPEPKTRKSTKPPAVLIAIAAAIMLIGVGRCGFLQPIIHGVTDDYGISGAFFLVIGFVMFILSLIWLLDRRRS